MKLYQRYCFCLCLLIFGHSKLFGQVNNQWADSVLSALENYEDANYTSKSDKCDTLLQLFEQNNQFCKRIKTLLLNSYYLVVLSKEKQALTVLNRAQQLFDKNVCDSLLLFIKLHACYGNVYIHLNEFTKARQYLQKGIQLANQLPHPPKEAVEVYMDMAVTYTEMDSQLYYNNKALDLARQLNELRLQEIILNSIGCCYAESGVNDKAIHYFRMALVMARNRNAFSVMSSLYNNLAGLAKNTKETLIYIDSAIYFAKLKGDIEDLQTAYQNKGFFLYSTEQYKEAYDVFYESALLKDSMYNSAKIRAFADMEQKYESVKKEAQISLLNEQAQNRTNQRNVLLIGALALVVFSYSLMRQRDKVKIEKKRSDELLLNILPSEVAEELKQTGESVAKQYNHVTVLFTDFVNFTGISQQMSPTDLVEEIHKNFTAFDAIMEKHGVEKIKTIGDAYLAVAGLPVEMPDHAQRMIKAALEIKQYMLLQPGKFDVRIGINSGPVVAGIVGIKKFAYDIWGDTVNTAARMEQHSEAGKINISGSTYELVKNDFTCEYRGKIKAKNKGEVDMYFVIGQ